MAPGHCMDVYREELLVCECCGDVFHNSVWTNNRLDVIRKMVLDNAKIVYISGVCEKHECIMSATQSVMI